MSLSRTFSPVLHFEDGNGHPLAGGYLCTYIAGTNTPVATFRDGNGTLNPTQIQLDSRGECEVWLDASIRYKFALYDSTKTTPIWTKDDITAPGVVVMPDTKEVQVVGTSPVLVSAVTNNGITTFTVALDSSFTTAVSKNTQDIAAEVSRATTAEGQLNTAIGNESFRAQGKENELGTAISNEVTRAQAAEAAAKTVVAAGDNINVDESTAPDGHTIYTVHGVESVPNVNITSPNHTINVTSSEDHQTNTKTFSIDVKGKALSLGWFTSRTMTYDSSLGVFKTDLFDKVNNGYENPQGDKITYDDNTNKVYIAKGIWHIDAAIEIDWTGTPQNKFIYIAGLAFDLSYNHKETFSRGLVRQVNASTALAVTAQVSETPPQGLQVRATFCEIYALEQAQETVTDGLESVVTDDTLTGNGTEDSPLGVVVDSALSSESENPVQNKVIYDAIEGVKGIIKNGGALTDAASIDVPNNSMSTLSTTQAALTLNVNCAAGEVPNFAVEISTGAAVTLTVTKTVGSTVTTLYPSEAGGNALESGKYYQITCVGNCWTLAPFTRPSVST